MSFGIDPSSAETPATAGPSADPASRWLRPLIAATVVVLLGAGAATAWFLTGAAGLDRLLGRGGGAVTIGISLIPDATGTKVEVVAEDPTGSLPATVDVQLTRKDDAKLPQGTPSSTGSELTYSDVQDGFGYLLPADQIRTARLVQVHTDGRRLKLDFHVGALDQRRIIYPVPQISGVDWSGARVYTTSSSTCWGSPRGSNGSTTFAPCNASGSDLVDGSRYSSLRLELTP